MLSGATTAEISKVATVVPVNVIVLSAVFAAISNVVISALSTVKPVIATKSAKFGTSVVIASSPATFNVPAYAATSDAITILSPFLSNPSF